MVAVLAGGLGKEQRTTEPLGAIAIGVGEEKLGVHGQAFRADGSAISGPLVERMGMLIEGHGSDAAMQGSALIDATSRRRQHQR